MMEYAGSGELFHQLNKRGRFSDRRSAMVSTCAPPFLMASGDYHC